MSSALVYIFAAWAVLILAGGLLFSAIHRLKGTDDADEGDEP